MYRLLAIDIDGTLINSRGELTPATRAAIRRAADRGVQVVLATGRRYGHALPLFRMLEIDAPMVTASGTLIKNPRDHGTLYQSRFEPAVLHRAVAIVDRCGYDPLLCADTFAEGFDYYYATEKVRTPELAQYIERNPGRGRLWPDLVANPPPDVFAGFAVGAREQMDSVEAALRREMPGLLHTHVLHPPHYTGFVVEIAPAGVTKWSAVRRLAEQWGIGEDEICAVGDDVNDIPMIRAAGLGVAMGNALPEVKAAADRVAPTHDDNGLVQVVDWALA